MERLVKQNTQILKGLQNNLKNMTIEPVVIVAIMVGFGEVFKSFKVPTKFLPVINIVLGVGISLVALRGEKLLTDILQGVVLGLSASGLYDLAGKPIRNVIVKPEE